MALLLQHQQQLCASCCSTRSPRPARPPARSRRQQPCTQHHNLRASRRAVAVRAADGDGGNDPQQQKEGDDGPSTSGGSGTTVAGIPAVLLLFVSSAAWTVTNLRDELGDILAGDEDSVGDLLLLGLGLGDVAGALLWAGAMWYASPLQLLLVFLGKIDTERPSDWLMYNIGRAAQLPVDEVDYAAPGWVQAGAVAACLAGGVGIAALLGWGLGDPTWSISSGIGALFAAAVFEAGRPKRLSVDEAKTLEGQWQDFAAFANDKLQRSGRCHESEVFNAFRRSNARYRSADVLPDSTLRDMVRNWHPGVERTRTGYLRNMSLQAVDAARVKVAELAAAAAVVEADRGSISSGSALLDNIAQAATQDGSESDSST